MRMARTLIPALAVAALLVAPGTAAAQFERLYNEYKETGGRIDACAYSADELAAALGEIPADVRAYDPGFADALNQALDEQVGGCGQAQQRETPDEGGGTVVAEDGSPGPADPRPVRLAGGAEEPGFPLALAAAMAVAAALLGLGCGLALARYHRWRPAAGSRRAGGARRLGERLSDSFWVLRDRFGR
jgi:hypothetical protein